MFQKSKRPLTLSYDQIRPSHAPHRRATAPAFFCSKTLAWDFSQTAHRYGEQRRDDETARLGSFWKRSRKKSSQSRYLGSIVLLHTWQDSSHYMPSRCRCQKCLEIPSTAKVKVRSFHHYPKCSPQFQYIIDGETGIVTFAHGISQQLRTSCYNTVYQTTVKHRAERIDDFLLIKIESSTHRAAESHLLHALTNALRE